MALLQVTRFDNFETWRNRTNQGFINIGDLVSIYSSDSGDVLTASSDLVSALNDLNSRKVKRSGDTITGNLAINGTLNANGGTLASTQLVVNAFNTTATTLNIGGAATAVNIGAATGTTTIANTTLSLSGSTLVSSQTTYNLLNTVTTTLNIGGAATAVNIGAATGTTTIANAAVIGGSTLGSSQTTFGLFNTTTTVLNIGGAATSLSLGAATGVATISNATVSFSGSALVSPQTTYNLLNTTVTTMNFAGAATTLTIGATTGTTTIRNAVAINAATLSTNQLTFNLINTTATTLNIGGAATAVNIGAATGTTTIANALALSNATLSTSQATFNLVNTTVTTLNFAGAATAITIGALTGTTTVRNNLSVTGNISGGTWQAGTIAAGYGGTGLGSAGTSGYAVGDIFYSATLNATAMSKLAVGSAGKFIRSTGTLPAYSTSTIADTFAINTLVYASAANTLTGLATANNALLGTNGTGVPSFITDLPTAFTIGGAYVYRSGGTDIPTTDGGTGLSAIGTANQLFAVNATGTGLEYKTISGGTGILVTVGAGSVSIATDGTIPSGSSTNTSFRVGRNLLVGSLADASNNHNSVNAINALDIRPGFGTTLTYLINAYSNNTGTTSKFSVDLSGNVIAAGNLTLNGTAGFVGVNISGSVAQSGTGTFSTGTGAVSLRGITTVNSGKLNIGESYINVTVPTAGLTGTIDSFATATYRSGEYLVQVTQGTTYGIFKYMVMHNGTTVYVTEYGNVNNLTSAFTVTGSIATGTLTLSWSSATSSAVKVVGNLITV